MQGRKLTDIINEDHENTKYMPGIKLPRNVIADPDVVSVRLFLSSVDGPAYGVCGGGLANTEVRAGKSGHQRGEHSHLCSAASIPRGALRKDPVRLRRQGVEGSGEGGEGMKASVRRARADERVTSRSDPKP